VWWGEWILWVAVERVYGETGGFFIFQITSKRYGNFNHRGCLLVFKSFAMRSEIPLWGELMNEIVDAIKTKIRLLNKEVESAWREDWNNICDEITPIKKMTVRPQLEKFEKITIALVRTKAASMFKEVSHVILESGIAFDQKSIDELRTCVLHHFAENDYLKRLDAYIDAVERKFVRYGLVFDKQEWRTDLLESAFQVGIVNTIRDVKADLQADFILLATIKQNSSSENPGGLRSFFQCLELKPNFYGIGLNLNAIIDKALNTKTAKNICGCLIFMFVLQIISSAFAYTNLERCTIDYKAGKYSEAFYFCLKEAEAGDSEAQRMLSFIYSYDKSGIKNDLVESMKWLRKSAEQGNADACMDLGNRFQLGYDCAVVNDAEALRWYLKAADKGNCNALLSLFIMYSQGTSGVRKDEVQANKWLNEAIKQAEMQGDASILSDIANYFKEGILIKQDDAIANDLLGKAVKFYRKAADQGDVYAQNNLGNLYDSGKGVKQDYVEAVNWYRKAAEKGNPYGQYRLGWAYENAHGVKQDLAEALNWYRKSAAQGDADAQNSLGDMYDSGKGVKQDYAEAVNWYRKSAEQGNAYAQYRLGWAYANGQGVKQDQAEALNWYRKSAEQGYVNSQYNLGDAYYNGTGAKQDYVEAINYYRKAAEQGNASAQNNLGFMYANGQGVKQDPVEAVKWYRKAVEQGHVTADMEQCIDLARSTIEAKIARKELAKFPDFFSLAPKPAPAVEAPKAVFAVDNPIEATLSPFPACTLAAEQGDPIAQMILGFCYREGLEGRKDKDKAENLFKMAVDRYKSAAEKDDVKAQFELGSLYAAGEVTKQDTVEARKWFGVGVAGLRNSAEKGNENDQFRLGSIYAEGKLVQQDFAEAVKWYRKVAEKGVRTAQLELGKMYFWGLGVKQDLQEAEKWFSLISGNKYGVCSEYIKIAKSYLYGEDGLPQDETAAISWFKKAIVIDKDRVGRVLFAIGEKFLDNNKEVEAQKWLDWSITLGSEQLLSSKAFRYYYNDNYAEAAKWYRILAAHGDAYSQGRIGSFYKNGKGVKQDFIEAEKWLRMAANQGDAFSQNQLGDLYYEGQGVKKNFSSAIDWYKKAADQGNEYAQYNLGFMYRNGEGVPKNYSEAAKLFQKSADMGYSAAQLSLGVAYYYGEGVAVDKVQTLAWFTLAAANNNIEAAKSRDSVEKELKPIEVSKAQQLAAKLQTDIDKRTDPENRLRQFVLDQNKPSKQTVKTFLPPLLPAPSYKPAFTPNDIAVIIGIEKYRAVPPTEYAAADAGMVRDYLKALGIPERNIEFLADDRATLSDIRKVIETKIPNMVKANSRVIVYYAGHGAPGAARGESYLVPYDGDPSFLADTAYPLSRLYDRLSRLKAKEVLVILDSCFSGAGGRSVLAKNTRPLVMVKETPPPSSKSMIVLTSSRGSQITTSLSEVGHGAFTYFFLRALQEGNRDIGEVFAYLNPRVTEEAKRQNVDQTPTISPAPDKLKGRFLFAR
jgi:TPR repeat protein